MQNLKNLTIHQLLVDFVDAYDRAYGEHSYTPEEVQEACAEMQAIEREIQYRVQEGKG